MHGRGLARGLGSILWVTLVVACSDPLAPGFPERGPRPLRPTLELVEDNTLPVGALIREVTIVMPDSGGGSGSGLLFELGEVPGPVVVELAGEITLGPHTVPVTELLAPGTVMWFHLNGDFYTEAASIALFQVDPGGGRQVQFLHLSGPRNLIRFGDQDAGLHGLEVAWEFSEPVWTGRNLNDPSWGNLCPGLDDDVYCWVAPRDRISDAAPRGTITVRVYHAPPVTLKIDTVYGPNPGASFTTRPAEHTVTVKATVVPGALGPTVKWSVKPAPHVAAETPLPPSPEDGTISSFDVLDPTGARWFSYGHPGDLDKKRFGYEVEASVESGGTVYRSQPTKTVYQDEIDVVRQEYTDLDVPRGVPPRGLFVGQPPTGGVNTGDYSVMLRDAAFVAHLALLEALNSDWPIRVDQLQLNSLYRNPIHELQHIKDKSGKVIRGTLWSWHLYACAADFQTMGADSAAQDRYWNKLAAIADTLDFAEVEQKGESGVGHVHVEDHSCPTGDR